MFRANVVYLQNDVEKTQSLIIKTMPEMEGVKKEMFKESHIFETEIGMYTEVIPKFEEILRKAGDETSLAARCLYHSLEPKKIIIFEDLVKKGYSPVQNRHASLAEVKIAYKKLAKLHAVSYKLALEQPSYFDKYRHSFLNTQNIAEMPSVKDGIELFIEVLESVPSLRKFVVYFEPMRTKLLSQSIQSFKEYRENPKEGAYYVLCHGDFHGKNIMHKTNVLTGALEDVMLVDFQMCHMGSIANDLLYSFFMLLGPKQRLEQRNELLYYYFTHFLATLNCIGFKGATPKLIDLRAQFLQHKHFELFLLTSFLPLWLSVMECSTDLDTIFFDRAFRKTLLQRETYLKELEILLPQYLHLGYLEN